MNYPPAAEITLERLLNNQLSLSASVRGRILIALRAPRPNGGTIAAGGTPAGWDRAERTLSPARYAFFRALREGQEISLNHNTRGRQIIRFRGFSVYQRRGGGESLGISFEGPDGNLISPNFDPESATFPPSAHPRLPVPESPAAMALRNSQHFNRTPAYPESADFRRLSHNLNRLFNDWLTGTGPAGALPFREMIERVHEAYVGNGELGYVNGHRRNGTAFNGRGRRARDYVRNYFGLRPNPDGPVSLPGIPTAMSPLFMGLSGEVYVYADLNENSKRIYYAAMEAAMARFTHAAARLPELRRLQSESPTPARAAEILAVERQALDAIVDFGRIAAGFRQFEQGNWGIYGPMINSMLNRLGFPNRLPGFLDIIFQNATEASLKPWFADWVRRGGNFYTEDGYDPL